MLFFFILTPAGIACFRPQQRGQVDFLNPTFDECRRADILKKEEAALWAPHPRLPPDERTKARSTIDSLEAGATGADHFTADNR